MEVSFLQCKSYFKGKQDHVQLLMFNRYEKTIEGLDRLDPEEKYI